jgi:serine/threonine protein kinase
MIREGEVLQNRYRVEKQIGQGGMGAVYIATDERFGSTVAIKETLFTDEKFLKAFEREARLLNSLRHSALPRVSDHFVEGNGQFLVMEYIAGEDLSEQIEEEGKVFSVDIVLNWVDQLLDALDYLHSQAMPVIHRDIKPQNLKLTPQGQIILLDFGLAKGNATNPDSATAAKSIVGYSRNYASLEQIQGTGTDPRSDLYSLAATIYHLLGGQPPTDALTRAMNVLSDREDPLVPITKLRTDIPLTVAHILHESLDLNANQRPLSAKEMRRLLTEAKENEFLGQSSETAIHKPVNTNLLNQKTQIQPELGGLKQSQIKTETFPEGLSKETRLRPQLITGDFEEKTKIHADAENVKTKPKRRGLAIAATLGSLILIGSGASAVYLYSPEAFGLKSDNANTVSERKVVISNNNAPANLVLAESNSNIANSDTNANSSAENSVISEKTEIKEPVKQTEETKKAQTKTSETTKNETPQTKTQTMTETSSPKNDSTTAAGTAAPNDVPQPKAKDGREIPPEVWRKMTPRQRQQLRRALELQRQQEQQEQPERPKRPPPPSPY